MTTFAEKYSVSPFDPADPNDVMAERARQIVVRAFMDALAEFQITSGDDITSIITGLTVGIACIMEAHFDRTDAAHAAIRASFLLVIPAAIDKVRAELGMPPLPDV